MMNRQIPEYCDLIPLSEFESRVEQGEFIPWDGDGFYANEHRMSSVSFWSTKMIPEGATHIAWFNK